MPIMDVIVLLIPLNNHIGVSVIELAQKLVVLSDWLELLYSVHLNWVLPALGEEGFSLFLQLLHMHF